MRKIFALPAVFVLSLMLFSCSKDNPVETNYERNISWQSVDSLNNEPVYSSFIASENDAFFITYNHTYRIKNGNRTELNFNDSYFFPMCGDAFSSDYYVVGGVTSGSRGVIKIFDNNVLTSVMPDSTINSTPVYIKIISPGKIVIASAFKVFLCDNGSARKLGQLPVEGSGVYRLVQNYIGDIILCTLINGNVNKIYKVQNDSLVFMLEDYTPYRTLQSNNYIFKMRKNPGSVNVDIFTGEVWHYMTSLEQKENLIYTAGAETGYHYFITQDTISGYITGKYYTLAGLYPDPNFPLKNNDASFTSISEMRGHAFYFMKYDMTKNKTYIYRSKLE